jgi:hypothetical protein
MNLIFNTLTTAIRTKALAKPKPVAKPNPYLFDVREDAELYELLVSATDLRYRVLLPAGAYLIDRVEAVYNRHPVKVTWVLVNAKGNTEYYYCNLENDASCWGTCVRRFLGIEPKKTKTAKKTQTTKRSKR